MKNRTISRRGWLAGAGVALTLPWLEAFVPLSRRASANPDPDVRRLVVWVMCGGIHQPSWQVTGTGAGYTVGGSLAPLADAGLLPHATVVTGTHNAFVDSAQGHGPGCGALLTGVTPAESEVRAGISFDQIVAQHLASVTPVGSLQLATSAGLQFSADGYPPAYNNHFSWADETTLLPNLVEPAAVFERLVGAAPAGMDGQPPSTSVLDAVLDDAARLRGRLGSADRQRLEQYETYVREIEQRIQAGPVACDAGAAPAPGTPDFQDVQEHLELLHELIVLGFRCDLTRVVTLTYDFSASNNSYDFLGIPGGYHFGSIHPTNPDEYSTINRWMVERYCQLVTSLQQAEDATGGSLLDSCAALLCSEHGEGGQHRTVDLPCIIAGRAGGAIATGQHLAFEDEPFANVGIALMQAMGVEIESFGEEGNGPIAGLLT